MKTLLLSAASAAFVAAAFLAGATWTASGDGQATDGTAPAERTVTIHAGATALTLPASVLAGLPATARPASAPGDGSSRVHLVLESSRPRD